MITLTLLHPVQSTPVQSWTFEHVPVIRVGRATDNHVILYSAVVSRHHVELRNDGTNWELVNIGTNGTYLNGQQISQLAIQDGTVIRLARSGPNLQINLGPVKSSLDAEQDGFSDAASDALDDIPLEKQTSIESLLNSDQA